jgi:glycosyltransferase involved in cell wall biosynthesis
VKILYLCADLGVPVLGAKGSSLHVRALASALARAGHEVAVAAPTLYRSPWDPPVAFEIRVEHVPPSDAVEAAARGIKSFRETLGVETAIGGELRRILYNEELQVRLKRTLERMPPDILLERASLFGTAGSRIAQELGVPHMVELNAPIAVEQGTYRRGTLAELAAAAERWTLARADTVLAVSAPLAEHAVRLGASPEAVHVIPNGVDPARFRPGARDAAFRRRLGLPAGPLLGFVGGLRPWHGIETLPELLARLASRHPQLQLVVAGDGPLSPMLREELRERGLAPRATLVGSLPQSDVASLLRELDVAVAPYPQPGHPFYFSPLKLFEYMACGAAVVASDVGQIAAVVRDGLNGLLVEPGNIDELAAACDRLLGDAELRRRLGSAAADDVRRRYTWDANAERIAGLATRVREARAAA